MPEELPRRYVTIRRRYEGKRSGPISAVVWDSVPDPTDEVWLTHVRPVVRLTGKEDGHVYGLIDTVPIVSPPASKGRAKGDPRGLSQSRKTFRRNPLPTRGGKETATLFFAATELR